MWVLLSQEWVVCPFYKYIQKKKKTEPPEVLVQETEKSEMLKFSGVFKQFIA